MVISAKKSIPSPTSSGAKAGASSAASTAFLVISDPKNRQPDIPGVKDGQPDEPLNIEELMFPSEITEARITQNVRTAFSSQVGSSPLQTPHQYLRHAKEMLDDRPRGSGRFLLAREIAKSGLEAFPDDAYLHYFYANRCLKDYNAIEGTDLDIEAETHFIRASELDPSSPLALCGLGKLYSQPSQERYAEAETVLFDAFRLNPADPLTSLAIGDAYKNAGFPELARSCFEHAQSLVTPEIARTKTSLSKTISRSLKEVPKHRFDTEDWSKIQTAIETRTGLIPEGHIPEPDLIGEAIDLKRDGFMIDAINLLADALDELNPDPNILFHLGTFHLEMGYSGYGDEDDAHANYQQAIHYLTQAHELDPNSRIFLRELGKAQKEAGNPDEAERAFFSALDIEFNDPRTLVALGKHFMYDTGNLPESEEQNDDFALARACFKHALDIEAERNRTDTRTLEESDRLLATVEVISGEAWTSADFDFLIETWEEGKEDGTKLEPDEADRFDR